MVTMRRGRVEVWVCTREQERGFRRAGKALQVTLRYSDEDEIADGERNICVTSTPAIASTRSPACNVSGQDSARIGIDDNDPGERRKWVWVGTAALED